MNANKDHENKFLLSFADILSLFRQSKKKIFCWALVFGLISAFFALTLPIRYQAEGTFREKGVKSTSSSASSVLQILGGGGLVGGESEAASLMTSRKILKNVIKDLQLQAAIVSLADIETTKETIKNNFKLAWASLFSSSPYPVLKDPYCCLKIEDLNYPGEIPLAFLLEVNEDGRYEVFDLNHSKQSLGEGKLGDSFRFEQLSMIITPNRGNQKIPKQSFVLTVNSLNNTVKELCAILKIESAKLDKSLLTLKCEHRDRYKACALINAVMNCYQNYLRDYHHELAISQLDYLGERRDQLTHNLIHLMEKHANYLAQDLYQSGFIESDKEMDFLAKNQSEYKRKLLDNELEIKRLTNIDPGNLAYYDRYSTNEGDPSIINAILSEMRTLKQNRDSLEIDLQKKIVPQNINLQVSFEQQLNELKEVQQYLMEIKEIAHEYEQGNLPKPHSKLMNDSRFLLKGWLERLENVKQDYGNNWKEATENFKFYLSNLERLFGVHERILQERLTHQQNTSEEYQGISLEVATNLYLDYSRQLIQMEGTIRQNLFFIHQIEDPLFEISSLSSGLTDPVSAKIIHRASELVLNLRDQNNQSMREQERIKSELNLQRNFLVMHLKQMVQLMELNKQLIDEKISALQNVSLELIHQQISLLEKNLQEYLKSRLDNLEQERELIKRHLEIIHKEMSLLPQKWVSEKMVTQEVEINRRIVEEIVKLVESKNISHKLEVIQSAPVDIAIPPLHPLPSKVLLLGCVGFVFGGLIGLGTTLGKTLSKGLKVSSTNLELMGYHVSGVLQSSLSSRHSSQIQEKNFDTLRRLQAYLDHSIIGELKGRSEAKRLLLLEGQGPDYASDLAELFLKRGCRVLTLDLNFSNSQKTSSPGLLQYLQGEIETPPIQKGKHGDWIATGGVHPFALEMLNSSSFQKLIEQLKPHYDWILAVSHELPCSVKAENLLNLFPLVVVTLTDEKIEELGLYSRFLERNRAHQLSFILAT